ncbi:MAG: aminotransferase class I/II-fold pyridoxal phosphate-dependent enzyme [Candidatus Lindowbacteria bacterium]|nr:aminotransferase class I/II-fold pyridoxal phosphate-dependent enzyme [Candidatus Lindowbacteria bacterium]
MDLSKYCSIQLDKIPFEKIRDPAVFERGAAPYVNVGSDELINFTTNNYLSLSTHPAVIEAAIRCVQDHGAGAGSSRLVAGTNSLVLELESRMSDLKETESTVVTTSGYSASLSLLPVIVGREDGIALEKGAHASLVAGSRMSKASIAVFRRDRLGSLERAIDYLKKKGAKNVLVVIDGIHSMDGDIAPLDTIIPIVEEKGVWLVVDDAHATGVLGSEGRGTFSHFDMKPGANVIQLGTLSKAIGSQGGYISASEKVIQLIKQKASAFIYTTGLSPSCVGAALKSLEIIESDNDRLARLRKNVESIRKKLFDDERATSPSPIIPIICGAEERALEASKELMSAGALTVAIRPPTVPKGSSRLRISVQADHRMFVEGADHSAEERYLVIMRRCAAE